MASKKTSTKSGADHNKRLYHLVFLVLGVIVAMSNYDSFFQANGGSWASHGWGIFLGGVLAGIAIARIKVLKEK